MTISLQSTFPPGYIPPGVDPQSLDAATKKMVDTTGITLEVALNLIGLKTDKDSGSRFDALVKALMTPPDNKKPEADPLGKLTPQAVSIDVFSVMALFQKCAQEMRDSAREVRGAETQAQTTSLRAAAQEIRNAAEDRFKEAVISGSFQIAGGAASVGLGAAGAVYGKKGIDAGADTTAGKILGNKAGLLSGSAQGTGTMIGGMGTIASSFKAKEAAEHDAKKAELEADATVHEKSSQQANDLMQQMMDCIRDVREKMSAIGQAQSESVRSIARNV